MSWDKRRVRNPELRNELDLVFTGEREVSVAMTTATPVNAVASALTLAAADIAILGVGDTVNFGGSTFTKSADGAGAGEFADTAGLAAKINALTAWGAAVDGSDIDVTAAVKGVASDGTILTMGITSVSTANGAEAVKATATIPAADIARLAAGDIVEFDGNTFTKVASDAGAGEFTNTAGLAALIDALEDWTAAVDGTDIDITAAANGAEFNDIDVTMEFYRVTDNGVDGTPGNKGEIRFDASKIYVCTADNTISGANWKYANLT